MKQIVFNEKAIEFLNGEKAKALDDIAVTIVHKDTLKQKDKEIERLNNIINELERYINEEYIYDELGMKIFDTSKLQDKLQELKGGENSE